MKSTLPTKVLCSLEPLATIRDKIVAQIGGLQPNPVGCVFLWHIQTPPGQGDWSVLLPARCVCICPLCLEKATSDSPAVNRELSWASALHFQRVWYLLRGREGSLWLLLWLQWSPLPRSKQRYSCVATGSAPTCMRLQQGRNWKSELRAQSKKKTVTRVVAACLFYWLGFSWHHSGGFQPTQRNRDDIPSSAVWGWGVETPCLPEHAVLPAGACCPTCTGGSMTRCLPRSRLAPAHWHCVFLVFLLKWLWEILNKDYASPPTHW